MEISEEQINELQRYLDDAEHHCHCEETTEAVDCIERAREILRRVKES